MAYKLFLPSDNVGGCEFFTQDKKRHEIEGKWDLVIAHPPCTYLSVAGNSWFSEDKYKTKATSRYMDRVDGIKFFMQFVVCNADRVCIENPVGIMSNVYRKPDQIIQPFMFGHPTRKQLNKQINAIQPIDFSALLIIHPFNKE